MSDQKETPVDFSVPEVEQIPRDLRSDQRLHKPTHKTVTKHERDKRDFKDTYHIKKGGGGRHNWGKLGEEILEEDLDELLEKEKEE